ncbi:MAG: DUF6132 family protein [Ginsengibacter sp.]
MKKWFNTNLLYIIGAFVGAIAGYLYWQQIGCSSGTCMITSKPINSTVYGALMGALLFGIFKKENKKQTIEEEK